jgi:type III pantothenate kinase
MTYILDVGNTSIKLGILAEGKVQFLSFLDHQRSSDVVFYKNHLSLLLALRTPTHVFIASVQPHITNLLLNLFLKNAFITPHVLTRHAFPSLVLDIDVPDQLGVDLIADAVAASRQFGSRVVIVDVGTATKVMAVVDNHFKGVSISPGIMSSYQALIGGASLLTNVLLTSSSHVYGKNTEASIFSGVIRGHAAMIDGLIDQGHHEYPTTAKTVFVLTGGYAPLVLPYLRHTFVVAKDLTLQGIGMASV